MLTTTDVLALIERDHYLIRKIFDEMERTPHRDEEMARLYEYISVELRAHTAAEKEEVYPHFHRISETVPEARVVSGYEDTHEEMEKRLEVLDRGTHTDPAWWSETAELLRDMRRHFIDEENVMFRVMRLHVPEITLEAIGERYIEAKREFKTRLRPAA